MRSWLVVVSCVFALACSDDKKNDQPKDVYEATLWPSTAELANDTLGGMDTETGDGRLHWNATPAQLVDVQPGRVLIAGQSRATPNGLMRFVTAVSTEGGGLTLTTINAPLQLAFKKLHVEAGERTATLDGNTVTSAAPGTLTPAVRSASGGGSLPLDFVAYDGDGNDATTDDQVYVNGNIGAVYDYTLGIDVDWGAVAEIPAHVLDCALSGFSECSVEDLMPEAAVGFFVSANADATATLGGAPFLAYEKEVPIFSATLSAFAIGPLVFFPEVTVTGHLTGKASSAFTVGAGAHAGFEGGLEFSTKTGPKSTPPTPFATFDTPTAEVA
ncbi:MAG TPA: hypothetical protein VLC93_12575, partial [Myxococcota bacterium]|nr:hypothetical protein [Myxococcota bacterium]